MAKKIKTEKLTPPEEFVKSRHEKEILINALCNVAQGAAGVINGLRNVDDTDARWSVVAAGLEEALGVVANEASLYLLEDPVERAANKDHAIYTYLKRVEELWEELKKDKRAQQVYEGGGAK